MNVPAPSDRSIQRAIARCEFAVTAEIHVRVYIITYNYTCNNYCIHMYIYQQKTLDEAHCILPNARWWIKGDGVDLTCSVQESVTGEWNGDVDLGDKILQLLRSEYLSRVESNPKTP